MRLTAIMLTLGVAMLAPVAAVQDPDVRLQKVIQQEITSGDLRAAIAEYRRIAEDPKVQRTVRAKALLQMADSHRKLGDAEAQKIYQRVIREFGDQREVAATATARLEEHKSPGVKPGPMSRLLWSSATGFGSPSADGRLASFTDWDSGDLAIRDLAAGTSRRLTATGGWVNSSDYAEDSRISPDGRWIAYSWFTNSPADGIYYDLRVIAVSAPEKPKVLHRAAVTVWVQPLAWTMDSSMLIVSRSRREGSRQIAELVAVRPDDSNLRVLATLEETLNQASVSPQGMLAFHTASEDQPLRRDIALLPLSGDGRIVRIEHAADDWAPHWSPDGESLFFLSDRSSKPGLWRAAIRGGKLDGTPQLIDSNVSSLSGIDSRGRLYYLQGGAQSNVYAVRARDLEGGASPELLSDRYVNTVSGGSWSADGQFFAYYVTRGARGTQVVIRDTRTHQEREVSPVPTIRTAQAAGVRWFPDGQSLLVTGREDTRQRGTRLYRMNLTTGQLTLLTHTSVGGPTASHPSLSGDGRTVFYIGSPRTGTVAVMALDVASGTEREILAGPVTAISLSPDSSILAILAPGAGSDRASELSVLNLSTGKSQLLHRASAWLDASRFGTLGWSRDGKHVLFVPPAGNSAPNELWRVGLAGGAAVRTGIEARGRIKAPEEVPGGGQISYSVIRETPAELWVLENYPTGTKR